MIWPQQHFDRGPAHTADDGSVDAGTTHIRRATYHGQFKERHVAILRISNATTKKGRRHTSHSHRQSNICTAIYCVQLQARRGVDGLQTRFFIVMGTAGGNIQDAD